ncbi:MAG: NADPH-dependent F420 reductase [Halobacteriaceae archaeon]
MDIALLGGTGDIGEGLALRWAADTDHGVVVGSREAGRAREKADEYEAELASRGVERPVGAATNAGAAAQGDVIVLAVPPYHVRNVVEDIADAVADDDILVNPAVGISRDDTGFNYDKPSIGSVTELVADAAPDADRVVGAYHNLPAARLADLDDGLGMDTLLVGDDDAKETVATLTEEIEGLGALDAGPIENASEIEALTPLLLTLKQYNEELRDVGVRFA